MVRDEVASLYLNTEVGGPVLADRSPARPVLEPDLEADGPLPSGEASGPFSHEYKQGNIDATVSNPPVILSAADAVPHRPLLPPRSPARPVLQMLPEAEGRLPSGDASGLSSQKNRRKDTNALVSHQP